MSAYNNLVDLVRNWANRDEEVLSNTIVSSCLSYAADKAYRVLRIPPLEQTVVYDSASLIAATSNDVTELSIPSDLIEFIQIRSIDTNGKTIKVFNEKADVRTFRDPYAEKYNTAYWSRQGGNILLYPGVSDSTTDRVELYYYKRLPALNARYDVTAVNANLSEDLIVEVSGTPPTDYKTGTTVDTANLKKVTYTEDADPTNVTTVYYETTVADGSIPAADAGFTRAINTIEYYGAEVSNWLRDENERVVLMGALAEAFIYLNEPDTAQMYGQMFSSEIQELNFEETRRHASGGNVQININGGGLI